VKTEPVVKEVIKPIASSRHSDYRQYNIRPELTQLYGQIADRAAAKLKSMQQNGNKN